ncbi:hypothetical protein [Saccharopolyspora rosea]|uniref:hypothetical protein n=1 Tax=Saccharopolyspora rosea TaxID=524884 RepID=UPI0021DB0446|nr:hypothetical protein [Saccharopolyspora rosea]
MPTANPQRVVAATARWLVTAFPSTGGSFSRALAEVQARQAVDVAAGLRYPTPLDVELLELTGPGGAGRLDELAGACEPDEIWREWVDEVLASWACCLLADPALAVRAVAALDEPESAFGRLTDPGHRERDAGVLLRHPDLLSPVADLHRDGLLALLDRTTASAS